MDRDQVWRTVDEQRGSLADLLDDLSPQEWDVPSLCRGWRVRDVAAHLTLSQIGVLPAARAMLAARGSFDRMVHDTAVRQAQLLPVSEYGNRLRAMVGSRKKAPGVTYLEPLIDVLVHAQDMVIPLGRSRAMPVDAAAAAATRVWDMGWPFRAQRRLSGLRLQATDVGWSAGSGRALEGPIAPILLLLTGRTAAVDQLSGAGLDDLQARLAASSSA